MRLLTAVSSRTQSRTHCVKYPLLRYSETKPAMRSLLLFSPFLSTLRPPSSILPPATLRLDRVFLFILAFPGYHRLFLLRFLIVLYSYSFFPLSIPSIASPFFPLCSKTVETPIHRLVSYTVCVKSFLEEAQLINLANVA